MSRIHDIQEAKKASLKARKQLLAFRKAEICERQERLKETEQRSKQALRERRKTPKSKPTDGRYAQVLNGSCPLQMRPTISRTL